MSRLHARIPARSANRPTLGDNDRRAAARARVDRARQRLAELEDAIEHGRGDVLAATNEIKVDGLYLVAGHRTFADYCFDRAEQWRARLRPFVAPDDLVAQRREADQVRTSFRVAADRLGVFAVRRFANLRAPWLQPFVAAPVPLKHLRADAEEVIAGVQQHLASVRPGRLPPWVAKPLGHDRLNAINALIHIGNGAGAHKFAKSVVMDITGDDPLTICLGNRYRVGGGAQHRMQKYAPAPDLPDIWFQPEGCYAVFRDLPDATRGKNSWPGFCNDCQHEHRQPVRDQSTAKLRDLRSRLQAPPY